MKNFKKILLITKERKNKELAEIQFDPLDTEIDWVPSTLEGIERLKHTSFDLLLCDPKPEDLSASDILSVAKELQPGIATAILSEEIRKEGAAPFRERSLPDFSMIAESPSMKKIQADLKKIAKTKANVFLIGESGTGKEVLANAVHKLSPRADKPFVRVNCAAVPGPLLESEFFGHEKGAFTGAGYKRSGRFELADTGSILLDEVSEIPIELQAKLLRAVQERSFERVGGSRTLSVDVRIISTSNRNMQEAIENKLFREDLFFRLHVIPIVIPPLRERKEDILPLARHFLFRFCQENGFPAKRLSRKAEDLLLGYHWPGNIRELSNLMERTTVIHSGEVIEEEDIRSEFICPVLKPSRPFEGSLAAAERLHILQTWEHCGRNKTVTAQSLGISLRTLRNKLKEYQIRPTGS